MESGANLDGWDRYLGAHDGIAVVFGSLGLAVFVVLVRGLTLRVSPTRTLGEINWSFSDSWASTLTAVGALLGTIVGTSGAVAENADPLSGKALVGLNLLFGFLVLLSPVL